MHVTLGAWILLLAGIVNAYDENLCSQLKCQCQFNNIDTFAVPDAARASAKKTEILAAAVGAISTFVAAGAALGIYKIIQAKTADVSDLTRNSPNLNNSFLQKPEKTNRGYVSRGSTPQSSLRTSSSFLSSDSVLYTDYDDDESVVPNDQSRSASDIDFEGISSVSETPQPKNRWGKSPPLASPQNIPNSILNNGTGNKTKDPLNSWLF